MQERAIKTREAILRAASELFDEYGYSAASISKIMKRAEVTAGAMYFHFSSKSNLAHAVMTEQGEDLELPPGKDGLQRLIDITLYLADELQSNPKLRAGVRLAIEQGDWGSRDDSAYRYWAEMFAVQLRAARNRGELLPEVDEEEVAWLLVSSYSGTQLLSHISVGRADLHHRVTTLWRYLLPGIAAPAVKLRLSFTARCDRAA